MVSYSLLLLDLFTTYGSKCQRHIYGDEHTNSPVSTFVEEFDLVDDGSLQDVNVLDLVVKFDSEVIDVCNACFDHLSLVDTKFACLVSLAADVEPIRNCICVVAAGLCSPVVTLAKVE